MKYDHSRKAGNRGDVWKHSVLVALADMIPAASDTFRYVESHAGSPVHDLRPGGEWECGVRSVTGDSSCDCQYVAIARDWLRSNKYPASWVFVAERLAKRFKSVQVSLSDLSDGVAASYPPNPGLGISSNIAVEFRQADGFAAAAHLDNADLVFLDPPFHPDAETDWRMIAAVCQRLAQSPLAFVAWYPLYWPTRPQWLTDFTRCTAWEVSWTRFGAKPSQNLKGCGMLVSDSLLPLLRRAERELRRISRCLRSQVLVRQPSNMALHPAAADTIMSGRG